MKPTVLVVAPSGDEHAAAALARLAARGVAAARVGVAAFPRQPLTARLTGWDLSARLGDVDLDAVRAVWHRRLGWPAVDERLSPGDRAFAANETLAALWSLSDALVARGVRVVNPLRALVANDSGYGKLAQLAAAAAIGLATPPTLVTNDPLEAETFAKGSPTVYKPHRTTSARSIYTTRLTGAEDLAALTLAPGIFQREVPKACDVRVLVVGDRCLAVAIDSQVDERSRLDFRRFTDVPHRAHDLSEGVQAQLVRLLADLGLAMGIVDLILTPEDRYVFLEVNQQGQFLWLEHRTGQPMLDAVCDFLAG